MEVTLDRDLAQNLLNHKLRSIRSMIEDIMNKWHLDDPNKFLEDVRNGLYSEAENDAIDLRQLLIEEKKLAKELEKLD